MQMDQQQNPKNSQNQSYQDPLFSRQAEESVIGSLLINNDAYHKISDVLVPTDFFTLPNQMIYQHIQLLAEKGQAYDPVILSNELAESDLFDQVGGLSYLVDLYVNTPTSVNIKAYANIVKSKATKRRLSKALIDSAQLLQDSQGATEEEVVDQVEQKVLAVRQSIDTCEDRRISSKALVTKLIQRMDEIAERDGGLVGLPTGFIDLDEKLMGMREQSYLIVSGRPSMGKTTFAMNIVEHVAALKDQHVAMFSMEMSAEDIGERLCASIGRMDYQKIRSGKLDSDDWAFYSQALDRIEKLNLTIIDEGALTPLKLKSEARKIKKQHPNLSLIVVDYLQLMQVPGYENNRTQEVSRISAELKALAKELKVTVIALSQLSRKLEERSNKRPMASDLRDSGSLEQDADIILSMYRDEVYYQDKQESKGLAEVIITKHRNGQLGTIKLTFRGELSRFDNMQLRQYAD